MLFLKFKTTRFLLLITCMSFTVLVVWIQFINKNIYISDSDLELKTIRNVAQDVKYTEVYKKADRLPKPLKYILLWSSFYYFGNGQSRFIENNCSHINCYVTRNKYFFKGDTTKFDAIAFNGKGITNKSHIPKNRLYHQIFIYFSIESADYYPVCSKQYDDFFNWTATYRLDSDIPMPYIQVRDLRGKVIGPKKSMKWLDSAIFKDEELEIRIQNKTKAVAWFVSNCLSRSRRRDYVMQLIKALHPFGLSVDIYGKCGPLKCHRLKKNTCLSMLEKEYYFYLSFENSFAEDYVTEKILSALQHYAVPIVLGGADYSRFLPPGSYINAGKMTPEDLASKMVDIMKNPKYYIQYFRWRSYYSYKDPSETDNVCAMCEALNDENRIKKSSSYKKFMKWWNPRYKYRCSL